MNPTNNKITPSLSPSQAREILWRKGKITDFLLDANQLEIRDFCKKNKGKTNVVIQGRQMGKTYNYVAIAVEECLQNKNFTICYVGPRLKQIKRIVKDALNEILKTCPPDMKPKFDRDSSSYIFPSTQSKIELYGFNAEEIESARGSKAHMLILDECGFMSDLKYGLRSVLMPKLNTTKGSALLCSTLPKSQGHEFYEIIKAAEYRNLLIKKDIYKCPRFTEDDIERFADEVGGKDSVDFKREYLNIMITDEDHAVIPEANDEILARIVKEVRRPTYFDPYVSMDIGVKDLTAVLYAYYDFITGKIIIEDEVSFKGKSFTTSILASAIKKQEQELWGMKRPYLRVSDNNNLILLNDLNISHGLSFMATAKDNKHAWINQIRVMIADERIIINPKCKQLIFHLKNSTWNRNKTDYERSIDGGHYDFIDSLAYLIRNVAFTRNPYPKGFGVISGDSQINLGNSSHSNFEQHLINMFSLKKQ